MPIGSISASLTACPLRGYGRGGTQNNRLSKAVILSTGTSVPAQWTCRRRCRKSRYRAADIEVFDEIDQDGNGFLDEVVSIVLAHIVVACSFMAQIVMAYIVMA